MRISEGRQCKLRNRVNRITPMAKAERVNQSNIVQY